MTPHEMLETAMLVCFSISRYCSVTKLLRAPSADGKSLASGLLVCLGYVVGLSVKLLVWSDTGALSPLVWVYLANLAFSMVDCWLVLRFLRMRGAPRRARPLASGQRLSTST